MKRNYEIALKIGLGVFLLGQIFNIIFSKLYFAYIYLIEFRIFSEFIKNTFLLLFVSSISVGIILVFNLFYKSQSKRNAKWLCLMSGVIFFIKLNVTLSELLRNINNYRINAIVVPEFAIKTYGSISKIFFGYVKDGSVFTIIGLFIIFIVSLCFILSKRNEDVK